MYNLILYFFIAVGLSMDAFSLAIVYGTNSISKKKVIFLSVLVGVFHFFMPVLGSILGKIYLTKLIHNANFIVALVFFILAIEMMLSLKDEKDKSIVTTFLALVFFACTVSLDSFSVGIALSLTKSNVIYASIIFSIVSAFFTFLGLLLGKFLSEKFGKYATFFGSILLFFLAIKYLLTT